MTNSSKNFLREQGPQFLLLSLSNAAESADVIEKINYISALKIKEKELILSEKTPGGDNALVLAAQQGPNVLVALLRLIKTLPIALQIELFKQKDGVNALMELMMYAPHVLSEALELIKAFPVAVLEAMFQQTDENGRNILGYIFSQTPTLAILTLFKLIKKCDPKIREKIIKHKDHLGQGIEFYLIFSDDFTLFETLQVMGFNLDREAKNNAGEGLFAHALGSAKKDMLSVLVRKYGLKPDIGKLTEWAEQPRCDKLNFLTPAYFNELYDGYLNTLNFFVMDKVEEAKLPFPKVLFSIVSDYLIPAPNDLEVLEASIDRAFKLRAEWLKPLFEHCAQLNADAQALTCLKTLLASKKLGPYALEKELDALLNQEGFPKKAHALSVINCRWNTEKLTGNKLAFSMKVQATFQFKVLCAGAAISVLTLALGLMALCLFNALVAGIAVTALGSVTLGGAAYGFYAHKKNTAIPEFAAPALTNMHCI